MLKYSGSEDVYKELVENSEESWLYGLVAFAVVEEQRIEWMTHYELQNGDLPKPDEIRKWYQQQHPNVLLRARGTAENALQNYSSEVTDIAFDDQYREIQESIIASELRELRRFWPQFGINLAGGFVAALLFAVLLTMVAFFVLTDASPVQIGKQIRNNVEDLSNGQEIRSYE